MVLGVPGSETEHLLDSDLICLSGGVLGQVNKILP